MLVQRRAKQIWSHAAFLQPFLLFFTSPKTNLASLRLGNNLLLFVRKGLCLHSRDYLGIVMLPYNPVDAAYTNDRNFPSLQEHRLPEQW